MADHPKITVVRASEHFSDPAALPTFNSHAVESQLHHIDGLAEHFLYCNDDMFFGRPVAPSLFFTPAGISRFIESPIRIGGGAVGPGRSGHENAARNNRRLLAERFGYLITRHLAHSPAPLRRSVLAELEGAFPDEFAATQASRFRSATDISVTNSLYHYYALLTGRAVPHESARACYIDTTSHDGLRSLAALSIAAGRGLLLPQRRQRTGSRRDLPRRDRVELPGRLFPGPGAVGAGVGRRARPTGRCVAPRGVDAFSAGRERRKSQGRAGREPAVRPG